MLTDQKLLGNYGSQATQHVGSAINDDNLQVTTCAVSRAHTESHRRGTVTVVFQ